jgi:hypothetical protein
MTVPKLTWAALHSPVRAEVPPEQGIETLSGSMVAEDTYTGFSPPTQAVNEPFRQDPTMTCVSSRRAQKRRRNEPDDAVLNELEPHAGSMPSSSHDLLSDRMPADLSSATTALASEPISGAILWDDDWLSQFLSLQRQGVGLQMARESLSECGSFLVSD